MDIIQIRRTLHQHPELGFEEHWTSAFLADQLRSLGLEVHENIGRTGLVGIVAGTDRTKPAIGYRADMDALPIVEKTDVPFASTNGRMHACGHDSHMAVALGTAALLVQRDRRPARDVVFVFQPNEEGAPGELPSGAELMVREGMLERFRIGEMIALHSDPTLASGLMGVCRGTIWAASGRFCVKVHGRAAHAAYPEKGSDALWSAAEIVSAMYAATARRRPATPEVVSVCRMQAGTAFNVVADTASLEGIIRAPSRKTLDDIADLLESTAGGIAQACDTTVDFERYYGADAVINDARLTDIALAVWQKLGVARVIPMNMAAEDFSHFANAIPTFYAMMGVCPAGKSIPPSHSDHFFLDESALEPASRAMAALLDALM